MTKKVYSKDQQKKTKHASHRSVKSATRKAIKQYSEALKELAKK